MQTGFRGSVFLLFQNPIVLLVLALLPSALCSDALTEIPQVLFPLHQASSAAVSGEEDLATYEIEPALVRQKRQEDDEDAEPAPELPGSPGTAVEELPLLCDFGSGSLLQTCSWSVPPDASPRIQWQTGQGAMAFWMGGPRSDHTLSDASGGYVFFETSYKLLDRSNVPRGSDLSSSLRGPPTGSGKLGFPSVSFGPPSVPSHPAGQTSQAPITETALLFSRNISETGPQGVCVSFFYSIDGLSADRLKVLLKDVETEENRTLWESTDGMEGLWVKGELAYTYGGTHQIIFEAVPKGIDAPERVFRGYIAVDDILFTRMGESEENCHGHCTFESGFCSWSNLEDQDHFDWELGRGSKSVFTGPSRDYSSFGKDEQTGGYAYIDASFPRRPGDSAMLISPDFVATGDNSPICLRFATHMFGNGIGSLRIRLRDSPENERIIWEISGEAGNNWYIAEVPISSASPYQLILEATVGPNSLGNIAIDNIAFRPGTCPISPQTASRNSGDCNFEENMCGWTNPLPPVGVDDFDWIRQYSLGSNGPQMDHSKRSSEGYYMNLLGDSLQPQRGGTRAWLVSPEFEGSQNSRCIAFFYYMYERSIDPAGPSLGSLRVYVRSTNGDNPGLMTPIWRLNNHQAQRWLPARASIVMGPERKPPDEPYQIIIEGIWGDGRVGYIAVDDISFFDGDCTTEPSKAAAVEGECSFDRDMCGWKNSSIIEEDTTGTRTSASVGTLRRSGPNTIGRGSSAIKESLTWRLASVVSRPANLQDHTFRAPIGYIFFDIFNQNSMKYPILRSPQFPSSASGFRCLSFWFTPFGRGDSTSLSVFRVEVPEEDAESTEEKKTLLWKLSTRRMDTTRPEWTYGQVSVDTDTDYKIQFEGEATDGGFALDDITFYDGACQTRPEPATVSTASSDI